MEQTDQNNELLKEAKSRMDESRKKVVKFNLLLILFFCLIIIGLFGALYYFDKVHNLNIALEQAKTRDSLKTDSIQKLNKSLEYYVIRAKQLVKTDQIQISDSTFTKGLINIVNIVTTSNLDTAQKQKRDLARKFSEDGYSKLKDYDFNAALNAFDKSEKALNGYRESYEIYYLLWQNRKNFKDPIVQNSMLKKILKEYNSKNILKAAYIK